MLKEYGHFGNKLASYTGNWKKTKKKTSTQTQVQELAKKLKVWETVVRFLRLRIYKQVHSLASPEHLMSCCFSSKFMCSSIMSEGGS